MGLLVKGEWNDKVYDTESTGGRFEREASTFRNWVTTDGEPAPGTERGFLAEPDRYHLYVSSACPWPYLCDLYQHTNIAESVNIKTRLAALWTSATFCYLYL